MNCPTCNYRLQYKEVYERQFPDGPYAQNEVYECPLCGESFTPEELEKLVLSEATAPLKKPVVTSKGTRSRKKFRRVS